MIKKLLVTSALFLGMIDTSYGSENENREDRLEESKPLICNQKFSIVVSESGMAELFLNPLLTTSLEYLEFDLINISEAKHLNFLADLF